MLHGDVIPVTRNSVQFGQPPLNGDIVPLPGKLEFKHVWPICPDCEQRHSNEITCEEVDMCRQAEISAGWILEP